ncbi:MAG: hypothetical protein JNK23_08720 [Opitutaceae bacterium]|nr:hypothetical protein [Opitutaceae bacterium]
MRLTDCPRNQTIRRTAFVERATELLPHSAAEIEETALARYGSGSPHAPSSPTLSDQIDSKIRFYTWFAEGKPAEFSFRPDVMPDGEIDSRFARCWQEAVKATPGLTARFTLRAGGFRVPLPGGYYRFNRSVLLSNATDDGSDVFVAVAPKLLQKGGLYRATITTEGVALDSLDAVFLRWKIALRMLRRYRRTVRPEILRRLRAGIPFEFARDHGELCVTLRSGRMPKETKDDYKRRAAIFSSRLDRVRDALAALAAEGQAAAEQFAARPEIAAAELAQARETAIADYRAARDRFWHSALESYHKTTLPGFPFRTPSEVHGRLKSSLSHRQRERFDHTHAFFVSAFRRVMEFGWNPLEETPTDTRRSENASQQMLAMEFSA